MLNEIEVYKHLVSIFFYKCNNTKESISAITWRLLVFIIDKLLISAGKCIANNTIYKSKQI